MVFSHFAEGYNASGKFHIGFSMPMPGSDMSLGVTNHRVQLNVKRLRKRGVCFSYIYYLSKVTGARTIKKEFNILSDKMFLRRRLCKVA